MSGDISFSVSCTTCMVLISVGLSQGGVPLTTPKPCVDVDPHCREWSEAGQCEGSSEYIEKTCPYSCGFCRPSGPQDPVSLCVDNDSECWKYRSEGDTCVFESPMYLMDNCKFTCGYCPSAPKSAAISDIRPADSCEDMNEYCSTWKEHGECEKNPMFMMRNCTKACAVCSPDICYTCLDSGECVNSESQCSKYCPKDKECKEKIVNSAVQAVFDLASATFIVVMMLQHGF